MKQELLRFIYEEDGVTAIEYGLIAGVIAVGLVALLEPVRTALGDLFGSVKDELAKAAGSTD